jgi:hypothetical protein
MSKPAILLLFFLLLPAFLLCIGRERDSEKDETLISGKIEYGGFGAPVLKSSEIGDDFAFLVGGRGGWILNHAFSIGGGGYGMVNRIVAEEVQGSPVVQFGYGGIIFEYILNPRKMIHFSAATLIGAGGVGYLWEHWHGYDMESAAFFVAEPEISVMLNVTEYFRMGVGGSYRYVKGASFPELSDRDLSSYAVNLTFKIGVF